MVTKTKTFSAEIEEDLNKNDYLIESSALVISTTFITSILIPTISFTFNTLLTVIGICAVAYGVYKLMNVKVGTIGAVVIRSLIRAWRIIPATYKLAKTFIKGLTKTILKGMKNTWKWAKKFLKSAYRNVKSWFNDNVYKPIKKYLTKLKDKYITPIIDSIRESSLVKGMQKYAKAYKKEFTKQFIRPFEKEIIKPINKFIKSIPQTINNIKKVYNKWQRQYTRELVKMGKTFLRDMQQAKSAILKGVAKAKATQVAIAALSSGKAALVKAALGGQSLSQYKRELLASGKAIDSALQYGTNRVGSIQNSIKSLKQATKNVKDWTKDAFERAETDLSLDVAPSLFRSKDDATFWETITFQNNEFYLDYYKTRAQNDFKLNESESNALGWAFTIATPLPTLIGGVFIGAGVGLLPFSFGASASLMLIGGSIAAAGTIVTEGIFDLFATTINRVNNRGPVSSTIINNPENSGIVNELIKDDKLSYMRSELDSINSELDAVTDLNAQLESAKTEILGGFRGYTQEEYNAFVKLSGEGKSSMYSLTDDDQNKIFGWKIVNEKEMTLDPDKSHRFYGLYTSSLLDLVTMFLKNENNATLSAVGNGDYDSATGEFKQNQYQEINKDDYIPIVNPRFIFSEFLTRRKFAHGEWLNTIKSHWQQVYNDNKKWIDAKIEALNEEERIKKEKLKERKKELEKSLAGTKYAPVDTSKGMCSMFTDNYDKLIQQSGYTYTSTVKPIVSSNQTQSSIMYSIGFRSGPLTTQDIRSMYGVV